MNENAPIRKCLLCGQAMMIPDGPVHLQCADYENFLDQTFCCDTLAKESDCERLDPCTVAQNNVPATGDPY